MNTTTDEIEFDLSEATTAHADEPIDWDAIDFEAPEPTIAALTPSLTSWGEIDGAALLAGDLDEPPPVILRRGPDGPAMLYRGKVSSIAGEPESGKGWFAMAAVIEVMADGHHVVYLDFEDSPKGVFGRLLALGVPRSVIAEKFHYVRPEQPLIFQGDKNASWLDLLQVLRRASDAEGGLALIVFDGITEALTTQGIEPNANDEVSAWFGNVPRRLAHATDAAVLLIDHVVKSSDTRGRYAIGAGAKLAAIDGSQFTTDVKTAFARGRSGLVRINVTKDRPGHVRAIAAHTNSQTQPVTDMIVTATDNGQLRITLAEPDMKVNDDGSVKPTSIEAAILAYMKRSKTYKGREDILAMVKGRIQNKRIAFNNLLDLNAVVETKVGRKTVYRLGTPKDGD